MEDDILINGLNFKVYNHTNPGKFRRIDDQHQKNIVPATYRHEVIGVYCASGNPTLWFCIDVKLPSPIASTF